MEKQRKEYKIVKLKGGFGNQLFQYAFAELLRRRTNAEIFLDYSEYNYKDDIRIPRLLETKVDIGMVANSYLKDTLLLVHKGKPRTLIYKSLVSCELLFNRRYFFEKTREYIDVEAIKRYQYFDGYWQSYKYVDYVIDTIKEKVKSAKPLSEETLAQIHKIKQENSVFVGIRRGDYLTSRPGHYGELGEDYYNKAMNIVLKQTEKPIFYIFSNDISWVKDNMNFGEFNVIFRDQIVDDLEEFWIMTACKHAIIANSTFHWWAARLNDYEGKIVIAPRNWFADGKKIDIVPNDWISI